MIIFGNCPTCGQNGETDLEHTCGGGIAAEVYPIINNLQENRDRLVYFPGSMRNHWIGFNTISNVRGDL